jgi:hypothetical protein
MGIVWTTLRFTGAIAVRVIPEPAVSLIAIGAYSKVCVVKNSEWLTFLASSGGEEFPTDRKHFVVFFDHHGSVEAIAWNCEVQP